MSVSVHRCPIAVLAVAALLAAGFAAPASASPWSDAFSRLSGWFAHTPFGSLWATDEATPGGDDGETGQTTRGGNAGGAPHQVVGNQGGGVDPNGQPVEILSDAGILVDPSGEPRP